MDPNDIIGPAGYGDEGWITGDETLFYTVRFENDSTKANAAAQIVTITHPIDPNLDPASFRLGSFGFGSFMFNVPENSAYYSERLDVSDSLGVQVDVTAGINLIF